VGRFWLYAPDFVKCNLLGDCLLRLTLFFQLRKSANMDTTLCWFRKAADLTGRWRASRLAVLSLHH